MKKRIRFSCLALIFTAIAMLSPSIAHSKITYRGFVETGAGIGFASWEGEKSNGFVYNISYTPGIQFKNSFWGVGVGVQTGLRDFVVYQPSYWKTYSGIPIYLAYRYDAFNTKKINFFGVINAGALFPADSEDGYTAFYTKYGVGIRHRLSSRSGLSFSINYYASITDLTNTGVLFSIGFDY
jgi:hypothetical protein